MRWNAESKGNAMEESGWTECVYMWRYIKERGKEKRQRKRATEHTNRQREGEEQQRVVRVNLRVAVGVYF